MPDNRCNNTNCDKLERLSKKIDIKYNNQLDTSLDIMEWIDLYYSGSNCDAPEKTDSVSEEQAVVQKMIHDIGISDIPIAACKQLLPLFQQYVHEMRTSFSSFASTPTKGNKKRVKKIFLTYYYFSEYFANALMNFGDWVPAYNGYEWLPDDLFSYRNSKCQDCITLVQDALELMGKVEKSVSEAIFAYSKDKCMTLSAAISSISLNLFELLNQI